MENKKNKNEINANNDLTTSVSVPSEKSPVAENVDSNVSDKSESQPVSKNTSKIQNVSKEASNAKTDSPPLPKKPPKPPKLEDKPFGEFISQHLIPGLKSSIQAKGTSVREIKLIEGTRPVVGGNCWMVYCELSEQRRFWLCFNKEIITSDKTILLSESNSDPSIVESFLIDEKKTTLPLLISRVLQRLNGQKWFGSN